MAAVDAKQRHFPDKRRFQDGLEPVVAFNAGDRRQGVDTVCEDGSSPPVLAKAGTGGNNQPLIAQMQVRRLTPLEYERLMGVPDHYTKIPYRNKPASQCPDGPRYKALGNSIAVPVLAWIGQRIQKVHGLI